jgi:hypothetical protein
MHVSGHCEDCSGEVWKHVDYDEEATWKLQKFPCGCNAAT